jgi:adenosylhomocysteine nucleosidase
VPRLGVITGLASESECLEAFAPAERPLVQAAGASPRRAAEAARRLLAQGCTALLSFGIAGGLDPTVGPGTVIVADAVWGPDSHRIETTPMWRAHVTAMLKDDPGVCTAAIAGSGQALTTTEAKAALRQATGAAAVDMESFGVAEVAAQAGVPFLALRAIADPASRTIPGWLLEGIADDGSIRAEKVARGLFLKPWTVWALIGLARENGRALRSLSRVAVRLGPLFGLAG